MSPEITLLSLNIVVLLMAYCVIYPVFCGNNIHKIAINDVLASVVVLVASGVLYWGTGQAFTWLFFEVNWFWFTLMTYALIEIPLMLWYVDKYNIDL